jgi:Tol biopolymer transport system component
MRKHSILIVVLVFVVFSFGDFAVQSGHDLFQKALAKERAEGNLEEAITLYQKVIVESKDKALSATAQLRIGYCYEKLGLQEANKAFQMVIDNYPAQEQAVKEAREKLAILLRAQAVIKEEDKEITMRKVFGMGDRVTDFGTPSPNGKYFVYHHYPTGDLAIKEVSTRNMRRLNLKKSYAETMEAAYQTCWSRDSKQIAYNWSTKPYELRVVNLDGSNPRVVYKAVDWIAPYTWSPDGNYILTFFMKKLKTEYQLGLLKVNDGSLREFEFPVAPAIGTCFSPDGRYVALSIPQKDKSEKKDISILSLAEEKLIPLVEHPAGDTIVGWAPDGQWIFFGSNRSGTVDLWGIRVSEGKPQGDPVLIKKSMPNIGNPKMTQTGELFYSIGVSMKDVYVAKIDFDQNKVLESPKKATQHFTETNFAPAWSSDGKHLAFASKRDDEPIRVLCVLSFKTGEVREFFPELRDFRNPTLIHWSPDGQSVVHTGIEKSYGKGFYKTDMETGNMDNLFRDAEGGQIRGSCLSKDGKTMFYNKMNRKTKMSQLLAINLETQETKELYVSEWFDGLVLSPDERFFAFSESGGLGKLAELKMLAVEGGEPQTLYALKKDEWIAVQDWTPDGQYIIFSKLIASGGKEKSPESSLWKISPEGGEPQKIEITIASFDHLRIHPDGQHIAFTSGERGSEVWVMENFLPKK